MIIFGATGDLAYRKLIPALFELNGQNMIPDKFHILGIGRKDNNDDEFRSEMAEGIEKFSEIINPDKSSVGKFISKLSYYRINMDSPDDYPDLKAHLEDIDEKK